MVVVYSPRLGFEKGLADFTNIFLYNHRETLRRSFFDSEEIYLEFYHGLDRYLDSMSFVFVEGSIDLKRVLQKTTLDIFEEVLCKIKAEGVAEDAC